MKFVKRITALFLAMVMVMAMGITAFAAEATTYTITGPADGHTYKVYQIFTGDLSGTTLSNIRYGKNSTSYDSSKTEQDLVPDATLTTIAGYENNTQATADAIAAYVNFNSDAVATLTDSNKTYTAAPGYYLIKDEGPASDKSTISTYFISVVDNVTVAPKRGTVDFEKKVKDVNDSDSMVTANTTWNDSADYDIGDMVPFQLTGTVGSDYDKYTVYYFEFQDQMEKGLTFLGKDDQKTEFTVKVGETTITSGFEVQEFTPTSDGYTTGNKTGFKVVFNDLKKLSGATVAAGTKITIEYKAQLNSDAVLGSTGNVNEARLVYSNNPNDKSGGERGKTPWDANIVFTYKVVVNKVDQDNKALADAEFTLKKVNADNTETVIATITAGKNQAGTEFTFSGLDDGTYVLSETKTPEGYNTIKDITFTVSATHKDIWTGADRTSVLQTLTGNKATGSLGEITLTPNTTDGSLTSTIQNKKGSNLPSTGGMGTTVLYVAGIAMIVVAGVVVIARKRNA